MSDHRCHVCGKEAHWRDSVFPHIRTCDDHTFTIDPIHIG